jgi:hypothetical protein
MNVPNKILRFMQIIAFAKQQNTLPTSIFWLIALNTLSVRLNAFFNGYALVTPNSSGHSKFIVCV